MLDLLPLTDRSPRNFDLFYPEVWWLLPLSSMRVCILSFHWQTCNWNACNWKTCNWKTCNLTENLSLKNMFLKKPVLCWHLPFAFYTSIENPVTEKLVTEKPVSEKPVSEKTVSEKPVLCLHLPFNTSIKKNVSINPDTNKTFNWKTWYKKNCDWKTCLKNLVVKKPVLCWHSPIAYPLNFLQLFW